MTVNSDSGAKIHRNCLTWFVGLTTVRGRRGLYRVQDPNTSPRKVDILADMQSFRSHDHLRTTIQ